ncbi:ent-kaurene oxidase, partial [Pyricularia oryzae Y34]
MSTLELFSNITSPVSDDLRDGTAFKYAPYLVTAIFVLAIVYSKRESYPDLPRLNPKGPLEFGWAKRLNHFMVHSPELLAEASRRFGDNPFKLFTDLGDIVVVPAKYANELKNHRGMNFMEVGVDSVHTYLPGFEPFAATPALVKVVNNNLTKTLAKLTAPMVQEAALGSSDIFGESKEWHEVSIEQIMGFILRISSRIFIGQELCRSKQWLEASRAWTHVAFQAVFTLRAYPRFWRPWIHWSIPCVNDSRRKLKLCREVLQPYIDKRNIVKAEAIARGEPSPFDDSIEWFEQENKTDFDPAQKQLQLIVAAVHTTTDLLVVALVNIAKNPEIIGPLREEIISSLSEEGLKISAFEKLKLMDAVFKESQRLKPIATIAFRRKAMEDVVLSDGFKIKKGTIIGIDGIKALRDERVYPDPLRWDPYRYIKLREAGEAAKARLVSVTQEHFGFGHGFHACPGRFFAANELKIALARIILNYDITVPEDVKNLPEAFSGSNYKIPKGTRFLFKRRKEELDLSTLVLFDQYQKRKSNGKRFRVANNLILRPFPTSLGEQRSASISKTAKKPNLRRLSVLSSSINNLSAVVYRIAACSRWLRKPVMSRLRSLSLLARLLTGDHIADSSSRTKKVSQCRHLKPKIFGRDMLEGLGMRVKIGAAVLGVGARVDELDDFAEYIAINSRKVE